MIGAGWTIAFEGKAWCESDLTVADAARAIAVCGGDWADFHPRKSPDHFAAILATFLAVAGEQFDAALVRVSDLPMAAAFGLILDGEPELPAVDDTSPQVGNRTTVTVNTGADPVGPSGPPSGVREPRRPVQPTMSGGAALEVPNGAD